MEKKSDIIPHIKATHCYSIDHLLSLRHLPSSKKRPTAIIKKWQKLQMWNPPEIGLSNSQLVSSSKNLPAARNLDGCMPAFVNKRKNIEKPTQTLLSSNITKQRPIMERRIGSGRLSINSNDTKIQSRKTNDEPEWFRCGPVSQWDTIELHGFEEDGATAIPVNNNSNKLEIESDNEDRNNNYSKDVENFEDSISDDIIGKAMLSPGDGRTSKFSQWFKKCDDAQEIQKNNYDVGGNNETGNVLQEFLQRNQLGGNTNITQTGSNMKSVEELEAQMRIPTQSIPVQQAPTNAIKEMLHQIAKQQSDSSIRQKSTVCYISQPDRQRIAAKHIMANASKPVQPLHPLNQLPQRIPSPLEIQYHTQSVIQQALLKKKVSEQHGNIRHHHISQVLMVSPQQRKLNSSPGSGLSFTPTSVLRKMTAGAEKEESLPKGRAIVKQQCISMTSPLSTQQSHDLFGINCEYQNRIQYFDKIRPALVAQQQVQQQLLQQQQRATMMRSIHLQQLIQLKQQLGSSTEMQTIPHQLSQSIQQSPPTSFNSQQPSNLHNSSNTEINLTRWFSPELLAKANAGKLPVLKNLNQVLIVEDFERSQICNENPLFPDTV